MPTTSKKLRRSGSWISAEAGNIYYRPIKSRRKRPNTTARLPRPLIEARRPRPNSIYIVAFPPGYIPRELRPKPAPSRARGIKVRAARATQHFKESKEKPVDDKSGPLSIRPIIDKILRSLAASSSQIQKWKSISLSTNTEFQNQENEAINPHSGRLPPAHPDTNPDSSDAVQPIADTTVTRPRLDRRPRNSTVRKSIRFSTLEPTTPMSAAATEPAGLQPVALAPDHGRGHHASTSLSPALHCPSIAGKRHSIMSVRSSRSFDQSPVPREAKPVATGSGLACSIVLAEPIVFLSGFDHDGTSRFGDSGASLLRGTLQLHVSRSVKIKSVSMKLIGHARTEWPEGIPPRKDNRIQEMNLRTQVLSFFNILNHSNEHPYGYSCIHQLKKPSIWDFSSFNSSVLLGQSNSTVARDSRRLSLQSNQLLRHSHPAAPYLTSPQIKGYKVFRAGTYEYPFELPIDHHQLETTSVRFGTVKWELQALVERAGTFKQNLHGVKEITMIRIPDQMSLEMTEPISISKNWDSQLHYDIAISGKSFPIGGKIPIALKLTPLRKVHFHKIKIFVTETVEYWTLDRQVTRKDPVRKILLLEKTAGKPMDTKYQGSSEFRTIRGGESTPEQRSREREAACRRRGTEIGQAEANGTAVSGPFQIPPCPNNLLGDLELNPEHVPVSEFEVEVQLPTCEAMAKNKSLRLHPDCTWKNVRVYHWIKIVLRVSREDEENAEGKKRRHFEISIDSPFTVLNCRAAQVNQNLPAYHNLEQPTSRRSSCGCPDARAVVTEVSPTTSLTDIISPSTDGMPAMPEAVHLVDRTANRTPEAQGDSTPTPTSQQARPVARPMHLLRTPSFNPPEFEDDIAPPPLTPEPVNEADLFVQSLSPPPEYDSVIGSSGMDGLADYFTRLANYGYDCQESPVSSDEPEDENCQPRIFDERSGRVNVINPRTPGGRIPSRSMERSLTN